MSARRQEKESGEKDQVLAILSNVYDPDYRERSVLDMGLVSAEDIVVGEERIEVQYQVSAPMCPFSAALGVMIQYALEKCLDREVSVRLEPGCHQEKEVNEVLSSAEKRAELLQRIENYDLLAQCVKLGENGESASSR